MIEQILGWLVGIYILFYIPVLIYFNVIQISCKWRCRKKKYSKLFNPCKESDCKFRKYCDEYQRENEHGKEYARILDEWRESLEQKRSV